MALSNQEILDAIAEKSVMDIVELVKMMEEKFGVTAAVAAAPAAAAGPAAAAAVEKTEFTVVLAGLSDPAKKVNVIKVVREITGLGLKEAKDMVEAVPSKIKEGLNAEDAKALKEKLEAEGAKADVKPAAA
jgi:large subunit ribosomal protein L7/L12